MHRRQILAVFGAGSLAVVAYRIIGGSGMTARGLEWPRGLTPAVTPAGDHYLVSKNFSVFEPRIDSAAWRLDLHGHVARPVSLSLEDLRAMPRTEQHATLACVGNSIPARAISTALWAGVKLSTVLEAAGGPAIHAGDLVFTAGDNYTDSIPLARALHPGTLLAYEMNGQPVPREHGAPLRAIVPGIYGMKNVKWIEAIEIVSGDYLGYWQQRGWSDAAPYQTLARIDEPRRAEILTAGVSHQICGIAFSGDRGISHVQLDITADNGARTGARTGGRTGGRDFSPAAPAAPTARAATLLAPLSPYTWVLWTCDWRPPGPGQYTLTARAFDSAGAPQITEQRPSFPDGATGLHTIEIAVQ